MRLASRAAILVLLLIAACPEAPLRLPPIRPPPPSPEVAPPPLLTRVPPGCDANLAGTYSHRDDLTFRYAIADDGHHLHIRAFRQYGSTVVDLPLGAEIDLRRTATGIHGESAAIVRNRLQQPCPVHFPYELTACSAEGLTLRTTQRIELGDDCRIEDAIHLDLVETVLLRLPSDDAGPTINGVLLLDGGPWLATPDGGGPTTDGG